MLSICMHACSQLLPPVVDGRVNNVLLQAVPNVHETQLQLIDTVHTTFIRSLLHNNPDIQVWAVWWPEIITNEVRRFLLFLAVAV